MGRIEKNKALIKLSELPQWTRYQEKNILKQFKCDYCAKLLTISLKFLFPLAVRPYEGLIYLHSLSSAQLQLVNGSSNCFCNLGLFTISLHCS